MQNSDRKSGEFALIDSIERDFEAMVPVGTLGIGDDCAVLPLSQGRVQLISKDMLLEGVHFSLDVPPRELGRRAVEVNKSDIAAMGGTPTAIFLGLALPKGVKSEWVEEFFEGVRDAEVPLLGGDTTSSRGGVVVSVTVVGEAYTKNLKLRSAAKVGDVIAVSGKLGGSAYNNYKAPVEARTKEGVWLGARCEVHAMMDISDGVAGDLPHILNKSAVSAVVELNDIPIAQGASLENALGGGEDYELLFTVKHSEAEKLREDYRREFERELYIIGEIVANADTPSTLTYTKNGVPQEMNVDGFKHF